MTAFEHTSAWFSEAAFRDCGAMVAVVLNYNKKGLIAAGSGCDSWLQCILVAASAGVGTATRGAFSDGTGAADLL